MVLQFAVSVVLTFLGPEPYMKFEFGATNISGMQGDMFGDEQLDVEFESGGSIDDEYEGGDTLSSACQSQFANSTNRKIVIHTRSVTD